MINCTPELMYLTIDFHEDFILLPFPVRMILRAIIPSLTDFVGNQRAEPLPPEPDCFVTNINSASMEEVINIAN
jgi:hypothetical protein